MKKYYNEVANILLKIYQYFINKHVIVPFAFDKNNTPHYSFDELYQIIDILKDAKAWPEDLDDNQDYWDVQVDVFTNAPFGEFDDLDILNDWDVEDQIDVFGEKMPWFNPDEVNEKIRPIAVISLFKKFTKHSNIKIDNNRLIYKYIKIMEDVSRVIKKHLNENF